MKNIMVNTEMTKAILDGRKTQTRRAVKFNDNFALVDAGTRVYYDIEFLLQKFTDGDGELREEFTQWSDAERIKEKILKASAKAESQKKEIPKSLPESQACSECHFFDSFCKKEKEICSFWGYDKKEFVSFVKEVIRGENSCNHFQLKKTFRILGFKNDLFEVEISENSQNEIQEYSSSNLHLFIHRYGKNSFVNLKEYQEKISIEGKQ